MNQAGEKDKPTAEHQSETKPKQGVSPESGMLLVKEKETPPTDPHAKSNEWSAEERAFYRWYLRSQWALVCITVGAIVVALGSLRSLNQSVVAQTNATQAAKDAADAAHRAADAAKVQATLLQAQERAWVGLSADPIKILEPLTFYSDKSGLNFKALVRLKLRNTGGTVALNVLAPADVVVTNRVSPKMGQVAQRTCDVTYIAPFGLAMFPGLDGEQQRQPLSAGPYQIERDAEGRVQIYLVGCITYRDNVTTAPHHTWFCMYFLSHNSALINPKGIIRGEFEMCPMGQSAD